MKRKSRTFVPSTVTAMEDRVVPSGIPTFNGIPAITATAYSQAYFSIVNAFNRFTVQTHNFTTAGNYAGLAYHLNLAIASIPFHQVSGLNAAMNNIVAGMQTNINNGINAAAVIQASEALALSSLSFQVQTYVAAHREVWLPV
jgi:hypothetical protein